MRPPDQSLRLLQGSREFFPALEAAFDAAQHSILLETYIFDFTASGADVGAALVRAAQRGLRVQLVMDGVGTGEVPADWRERFDAAGVQWHVYSPLGALGLLLPSRWRRLHRKLCLVDGRIGFCGGINLLDDYYDPNHGRLEAPRFDFAVRIEGEAAAGLLAQLGQTMGQLWQRLREKASMQSRLATFLIAKEQDSTGTQLVLRDNFRNRKKIELAYRKAIGEARQSIVIANAYFLPGGKLRRALVHAAGRGVKVQLLLQGRYEYFMQYHASRPIFHTLLAAGIEIHEYAPSFLHAKVAVIDAHGPRPWATVGSSNLDPLSLLLAREANLVAHDPAFAMDLHSRLQDAIAHGGTRMDPQAFANRPWPQRARDWMAFGLMRLALWAAGQRY